MIRVVEPHDVAELARLMGELGYPTSEEEMKKRMDVIFTNASYHTLVYEHDEQLVGMIGMIHCYRFEKTESYIRIIDFVVQSELRGKGIGKELLKEAEKWAIEKDAAMVTLNSGNRSERNDAHIVYKRWGFEGSATGFYKKLTSLD